MSETSRWFALNEEHIGNSRIGYLVDFQHGFGISCQFQMLIKSRPLTIIEVFMDEVKAVDWILQIF